MHQRRPSAHGSEKAYKSASRWCRVGPRPHADQPADCLLRPHCHLVHTSDPPHARTFAQTLVAVPSREGMARIKRPAVPAGRTAGAAQRRRVISAGGNTSASPSPREGEIPFPARLLLRPPLGAHPRLCRTQRLCVALLVLLLPCRLRERTSPLLLSPTSQSAPADAAARPAPPGGMNGIIPGTAVSHAGRAIAVAPIVPYSAANVNPSSSLPQYAGGVVTGAPSSVAGGANGTNSHVVGAPGARNGVTVAPCPSLGGAASVALRRRPLHIR